MLKKAFPVLEEDVFHGLQHAMEKETAKMEPTSHLYVVCTRCKCTNTLSIIVNVFHIKLKRI